MRADVFLLATYCCDVRHATARCRSKAWLPTALDGAPSRTNPGRTVRWVRAVTPVPVKHRTRGHCVVFTGGWLGAGRSPATASARSPRTAVPPGTPLRQRMPLPHRTEGFLLQRRPARGMAVPDAERRRLRCPEVRGLPPPYRAPSPAQRRVPRFELGGAFLLLAGHPVAVPVQV
jgi:hypothetical protein